MIGLNLRIRPAVPADEQQIADLISSQQHIHRHLDWRAPLEWLGSRPYFVLEKEGRIYAALACPPDPPSIFWIRLFVFDPDLSGPFVWPPLWDAVRGETVFSPGATVAAITTQHWFESILLGSGFTLAQHIVMLEWTRQRFYSSSVRADVRLRPMTYDDLPRVAEVDAAAFAPLWQNSLSALGNAYSQALYASVAENSTGIVGYQLSTKNAFGAHLARLAVRPEAQRGGIASALIDDMMRWVCRDEHLSRITVNTQSDNPASLALYEKIGFRLTGEQYPIYIHQEDGHGTIG